jgi:drug/metabolite transporter (DMT)-like permease
MGVDTIDSAQHKHSPEHVHTHLTRKIVVMYKGDEAVEEDALLLSSSPPMLNNETKKEANSFQYITGWISYFLSAQLLIHCAQIFVQALYGYFGVIGPMSLEYIHPFVFACGRIFLIGSSMAILAIIFDNKWYRQGLDVNDDRDCGRPFSLLKLPDWKDGLLLLLLGVMMSYGVFSYVLAVKLAPYTIVAILQPTMTAFACFFSIMLKREGASIYKIVGVLLAVLGSIGTLLIISISEKKEDSTQGNKYSRLEKVLGALIELSNSIVTAMYLVTQKTVLSRGVPPFTCVAWTFSVSFAISIGVASYFFNTVNFMAIPLVAWLGLLYGGLVIGTLTFSINSICIKYSTPTIIAIYNTTAPIYSVIFQYIFNGQTTTWLASPGAIAIAIGVILVAIGRQRESQAEKGAIYSEEEANIIVNHDGEKESLLKDSLSIQEDLAYVQVREPVISSHLQQNFVQKEQ